MANRYLVGATNWNSTTAWSDQSGGASGFSVPTSADDVFLDGASPSGSTINANITVKSLDCNGFTGTLTHAASVTLTVAGNGGTFRLSSGMTYTLGSVTTSALSFTGTSGTMSFTTSGKTVGSTTLNAPGMTLQLQDAVTIGAGLNGTLTLTAGTLDCNSKNMAIPAFSSSNSNARAIKFGSSVWSISSSFTTSQTTNLTITRDTGSVVFAASVGPNMFIGDFYFPSVTFNMTPFLNIGSVFRADSVTAGSNNIEVRGGWNVGAFSRSAGQTTTFLINPGATSTVTSNGQSFANVIVNGGTVQLADAFTATGTVTVARGTLNANNMNVTVGVFLPTGTGTSSRTVQMGTGTWTLTGTGTVWNCADSSLLTVDPGTSTIKITDASATDKIFFGGSITYYDLWLTGAGTGAFIIRGGSRWNNFKADTPPHTIKFQPGTIQRVASWTVSGTAGNLMTLESETTGQPWGVYLIGGGSASSSYVSVRDSVAF